MKRLICAVVILCFVFGITLYSSRYLAGLVGGYSHELTLAGELAQQGMWRQALEKTQTVFADWEERDFYMHVLLHHSDIDAIRLTFHEVQEYLKLAEPDQYTAANAKLVEQLQLLIESEQLTVKNVL